jgi:hypothetical protein
MNRLQYKHLLNLHTQVVNGDAARDERDGLLLQYHEDGGESQVALADMLNTAVPESVTRNAVQKMIQRQRKANA